MFSSSLWKIVSSEALSEPRHRDRLKRLQLALSRLMTDYASPTVQVRDSAMFSIHLMNFIPRVRS